MFYAKGRQNMRWPDCYGRLLCGAAVVWGIFAGWYLLALVAKKLLGD